MMTVSRSQGFHEAKDMSLGLNLLEVPYTLAEIHQDVLVSVGLSFL